jgi:hypothetical protein
VTRAKTPKTTNKGNLKNILPLKMKIPQSPQQPPAHWPTLQQHDRRKQNISSSASHTPSAVALTIVAIAHPPDLTCRRHRRTPSPPRLPLPLAPHHYRYPHTSSPSPQRMTASLVACPLHALALAVIYPLLLSCPHPRMPSPLPCG